MMNVLGRLVVVFKWKGVSHGPKWVGCKRFANIDMWTTGDEEIKWSNQVLERRREDVQDIVQISSKYRLVIQAKSTRQARQ